eukprot:2438650-Prymnesium_polylepis.2
MLWTVAPLVPRDRCPLASSGPSLPCLFGTVAPLPLRDHFPPASLGPSPPCLFGALAPLRCVVVELVK